jgi:hypothetical protein
MLGIAPTTGAFTKPFYSSIYAMLSPADSEMRNAIFEVKLAHMLCNLPFLPLATYSIAKEMNALCHFSYEFFRFPGWFE